MTHLIIKPQLILSESQLILPIALFKNSFNVPMYVFSRYISRVHCSYYNHNNTGWTFLIFYKEKVQF